MFEISSAVIVCAFGFNDLRVEISGRGKLQNPECSSQSLQRCIELEFVF